MVVISVVLPLFSVMSMFFFYGRLDYLISITFGYYTEMTLITLEEKCHYHYSCRICVCFKPGTVAGNGPQAPNSYNHVDNKMGKAHWGKILNYMNTSFMFSLGLLSKNGFVAAAHLKVHEQMCLFELLSNFSEEAKITLIKALICLDCISQPSVVNL